MSEHKRFCNKPAPAEINIAFGVNLLGQRSHRRPVRVAARKGRERLIQWTTRLNDVHADWVDVSELEGETVEEPEPVVTDNPNIISMERILQPMWETD